MAQQRERDISTDLGVGVAIPHARCPRLARPIVVFGRSARGVRFSAESEEPVRLVFLAVTPHEQPEAQLALLAQLSQAAASDSTRARLLQAATLRDAIDAIAGGGSASTRSV
jgi:mannitol/fructose-specific phosphotransferase system IIA component (Ntr-type)